jgi:hypothetical protein
MITARAKMGDIRGVVLVAAILFAGSGSAHAARPWRADERNTRGWQLMTPQERIEHQAQVRGFTDYAACQQYRTRHHDLMADRARQRGLDVPDSHWDFCDRLKPGRPSPAATE